MWTREELKFSAKDVLRTNYWIALVAILITGAISWAANMPFSIGRSLTRLPEIIGEFYGNTNFVASTAQPQSPIFSSLSLLITIFVTYPLAVGISRYFLNLRDRKTEFSSLFMSFKDGNYFKVVGAMAWQALFTFLWTLLFIIPGIIKGISYSMTPFILAENPKIGYKRAIKLSMAMTEGHKGDIFVLYLSFIGWVLLGFLACCGIGLIFLTPYINATQAELYIKLRTLAIQRNICTAEELNLVAVNPEQPQINY